MLQERFIRFSEFNPADFEDFFESEEGKWAGDSGLLRRVKKKVRISGMDGIIVHGIGSPSILEEFLHNEISGEIDKHNIECQSWFNQILAPSDDQELQPGYLMRPCREFIFKGPEYRVNKIVKKLEDFVNQYGGKMALIDFSFE